MATWSLHQHPSHLITPRYHQVPSLFPICASVKWKAESNELLRQPSSVFQSLQRARMQEVTEKMELAGEGAADSLRSWGYGICQHCTLLDRFIGAKGISQPRVLQDGVGAGDEWEKGSQGQIISPYPEPVVLWALHHRRARELCKAGA